jgi:hypothetical protein
MCDPNIRAQLLALADLWLALANAIENGGGPADGEFEPVCLERKGPPRGRRTLLG